MWLSQAAVEAEAVLGLDAEEAVRFRALQAAGWILCREFDRADSWLQERDPQPVEAQLVHTFLLPLCSYISQQKFCDNFGNCCC